MLQSSVSKIRENNWHHIAFSYDESGVNLYIDGILSSSNLDVNVDTTVTSLQNMILGSNIEGFVDNVKIFDKSLSEREIQYLAFEDNYDLSLSNKVTDLKFNEFKSTPTSLLNDSGNDATVTGVKEYSSGLVDGSKSIVMNNADISLNQSVPLTELSISAWVNLDNLTSGENVIFGNSDVKFYLDNGDIKLKLNNNDISFTDVTSGVISTKGERFNLNFQSGTDLDYSPDANNNNTGIVTTTVNNGSFSNDIISYPNASFYANKLTLSSWVKSGSNGTIFDLGNLNLNINDDASGMDVSIVKYINVNKTYRKFDTNITVNNINNVIGIVNNTYDGLLIGNPMSFTLNTDSSTKIMPKLIKFKIPLRNYSPKSFNIVGVVNGTETTLIDEKIIFKNPNHTYEFNINIAEVEYDSIKINFEGNGLLKVTNIEIFGNNYHSLGETEDVSAIGISGVKLLTRDANNLIINLADGVTVNASLVNTTENTTTVIGNVSNGFKVSLNYENNGDQFLVILTDSNGNTYNSNIITAGAGTQELTLFKLTYENASFDPNNGDIGSSVTGSPQYTQSTTSSVGSYSGSYSSGQVTIVENVTYDSDVTFSFKIYVNGFDFNVSNHYYNNIFSNKSDQSESGGFSLQFKEDDDTLNVNLFAIGYVGNSIYPSIKTVSIPKSTFLNNWNQIDVTLQDKTTPVISLNGQQQNIVEIVESFDNFTLANRDLIIGGRDGTQYGNILNCFIDEFKIVKTETFADIPPPGPTEEEIVSTNIFTFTGSDQTLTLPTDLPADAKLRCYLWGAGGGGIKGGYGGFTESVIDIESNETVQIMVGEGGKLETGLGVYGGGGDANYGTCCKGGGRSAIFINGVEVLTAGGGGGGPNLINQSGGSGGGLIGGDGRGHNGVVSNGNGHGGTQTVGGAGSFGATPIGADPRHGGSGSIGKGGSANWQSYKPGSGGGGYYGGGGGADCRNYYGSYAAGGGSGYVGLNGNEPLAGASILDDATLREDTGTLSWRTLTYQNTTCIQGTNESHPKYPTDFIVGRRESATRNYSEPGYVVVEIVRLADTTKRVTLDYDNINKLTISNLNAFTGIKSTTNNSVPPTYGYTIDKEDGSEIWYPSQNSGDHSHGSSSSKQISLSNGESIYVSHATAYGYGSMYSSIVANIQSAEIVINPLVQADYTHMIDIGDNYQSDILFNINSNGSVSLTHTGSGYASPTLIAESSPDVIRFNDWNHMVLTVDGVGNAIGYVNGANVVSGTFSSVQALGNRLLMSLREGVISGSIFDEFYTYAVNAYDNLLTQEQVSSRYSEYFKSAQSITLSFTPTGSTDTQSIDVGTATTITINETGKYSATVNTGNEYMLTNEVTVSQVSISNILQFDGANKLTIENAPANATTTLKFTPTGSTDTQSINVGTATTITINATGKYSATVNTGNEYMLTNEVTVSAITDSVITPGIQWSFDGTLQSSVDMTQVDLNTSSLVSASVSTQAQLDTRYSITTNLTTEYAIKGGFNSLRIGESYKHYLPKQEHVEVLSGTNTDNIWKDEKNMFMGEHTFEIDVYFDGSLPTDLWTIVGYYASSANEILSWNREVSGDSLGFSAGFWNSEYHPQYMEYFMDKDIQANTWYNIKILTIPSSDGTSWKMKCYINNEFVEGKVTSNPNAITSETTLGVKKRDVLQHVDNVESVLMIGGRYYSSSSSTVGDTTYIKNLKFYPGDLVADEYGPPQLAFDGINKLTIENPPANATTTLKFTPTGSTDTQSIDIGTATTITINETGKYSAAVITNNNYVFTNEVTVSAITDTSILLSSVSNTQASVLVSDTTTKSQITKHSNADYIYVSQENDSRLPFNLSSPQTNVLAYSGIKVFDRYHTVYLKFKVLGQISGAMIMHTSDQSNGTDSFPKLELYIAPTFIAYHVKVDVNNNYNIMMSGNYTFASNTEYSVFITVSPTTGLTKIKINDTIIESGFAYASIYGTSLSGGYTTVDTDMSLITFDTLTIPRRSKNLNIELQEFGFFNGEPDSSIFKPKLLFNGTNKLIINNLPSGATTKINFTPTGSTNTSEFYNGTGAEIIITETGNYEAFVSSSTHYFTLQGVTVNNIVSGYTASILSNTTSPGSDSYKTTVTKAPGTTYYLINANNDPRMGTLTQKVYDGLRFTNYNTVSIYMKYTTGSTIPSNGTFMMTGDVSNGNSIYPRIEWDYTGTISGGSTYNEYTMNINDSGANLVARIKVSSPPPTPNTQYEFIITISKTILQSYSFVTSSAEYIKVMLNGQLLDSNTNNNVYVKNNTEFNGTIDDNLVFNSLCVPRSTVPFGETIMEEIGFFDGEYVKL